jgi:hypothetical protein
VLKRKAIAGLQQKKQISSPVLLRSQQNKRSPTVINACLRDSVEESDKQAECRPVPFLHSVRWSMTARRLNVNCLTSYLHCAHGITMLRAFNSNWNVTLIVPCLSITAPPDASIASEENVSQYLLFLYMISMKNHCVFAEGLSQCPNLPETRTSASARIIGTK